MAVYSNTSNDDNHTRISKCCVIFGEEHRKKIEQISDEKVKNKYKIIKISFRLTILVRASKHLYVKSAELNPVPGVKNIQSFCEIRQHQGQKSNNNSNINYK